MGDKKVTLKLEKVSKSFAKIETDEVTHALNEIDLTLNSGEFISLVGPSGCGKSTILRLVAGLIVPTKGTVSVDGKEVKEPSPERGMVFQKPTLFPWLTVEKNIAFSLRMQGKLKGNEDKVKRMIDVIGLEAFKDDYPDQLSGGMAQRVALVRSLINEPDILLLDEPLGALDLKMRKEMQIELKGMHDRLGITFIYVTHDQEEALTMSDKIVVMSEGEIQQIGTPEDIYNEPKNAFVADFIGESNIFNGIMTGKLKVRFCGAEFVCLDDVEIGTKVDAVVRPEDVMITTPEQGAVKGVVTSVVFKGVHYEITVESGRNEIVIQTTKSAKVGDKVGLNVEPDGIHIMISETAINKIESSVNRNYALGVFDGKVSCDLTEIVPGSAMKDGVLVDANGEAIDREKIKVIVSILPEDIDMSDDEEAGIICGHIINLIYKGDHYSYVVRTDNEEDFIVDDEYLWNMEDRVSLIIPEDKMKFSLKK